MSGLQCSLTEHRVKRSENTGLKRTRSERHAGLQLNYWRRRWYEFDSDCRRRGHTFKITAGDRVLAVGEFDEWLSDHSSLNYFAQVADGYSSDTYEMGKALFSSFCRHEEDGESPLDYGSILMFDRVHIRTASAQESKDVWVLINKLVRRFAQNHGGRNPVAGIILKAHPLDNSGMNTLSKAGDDESRSSFDHRQKAMMRLYERRLGVKKLPGEFGQDGWLWLGLDCGLRPLLSSRRPKY